MLLYKKMNLECLNVLHEITVKPHPVPTIIAYTGSYLNLLMRRQIVRISGTISLQIKIPFSGFSVNETIPMNQSQYSFLLNNIHIPRLCISSSRNLTFVLIIFTGFLIACAWGLRTLVLFHMYTWVIPSRGNFEH